MNGNLTKKQVLQIIGACTLVMLMIACIILGIMYGIYTKPEVLQATQSQDTPLVIKSSSKNGIILSSSEATVASDGTTSQTIIATISPSSATNKELVWSLAFKNADSSWAKGKTVTDYVTITPDSSDDTICVVSCAQAFGEQIIVKCESKTNPDTYATATVDYASKVKSAKLNIGNIPVNLGGTTEILYEINKGTTGPGGVVSATIEKSDTYSIDKAFDVTVSFAMIEISPGMLDSFKIKGSHPTGCPSSIGDNINGQTVYFDYDHDIVNWQIWARKASDDVIFKNLTTSQVAEYFKDINNPKLGIITLTLDNGIESVSYTSTVSCTGYTINGVVQSA